ncbi:D-2-hydroxyacid dehydrogenase family protein [Rhodococcus sp. NPDC127530]|uniref:D-2-hydroxyacid dehydrogenase family protein n=1 Tax=unclassified Rhodococcus (in: high G+C Gram-positive bacteria) TaxID=192944 RepID=UPI00362587B8
MGEHLRVAVLDDYQSAAAAAADWSLLGHDTDIDFLHERFSDPDALVSRLRGHQVVVVNRERTPFPASVLERLPDLRLLVTTGPSNPAVDLHRAAELGITVSGTGGMSALYGTVEHTWALILAAARHITAEDRATRAGSWQTTVGLDLHGRRLGLLGLGNVGSRVARLGAAFGMDVMAWSPNMTAERAARHGARALPLDELLASADVVSVHLKLGQRSHGVIGAHELALMRPTSILVNTARGLIVDETALADALHAGTIGAAAVDVYSTEPAPSDNPLRTAPRCTLSPHLAFVTQTTYREFFGNAVEDILAWRRGEPIRVLHA